MLLLVTSLFTLNNIGLEHKIIKILVKAFYVWVVREFHLFHSTLQIPFVSTSTTITWQVIFLKLMEP